MSWSQEILGGGSGMGKELISGVVAAATLGTVAMKSIVKVPKNHKGIPTVRENPERTWGRKKGQRYKPVGSGLHVVYPFIGGIESRSMQKQPEDLPNLNVMCKDGKFSGDLATLWHVKQGEERAQDELANTRQLPFFSKKHLQPALYGAYNKLYSGYEGFDPIRPTKPPVSENDEYLYRSLFEMENEKLDNYIKALVRTGTVAAARGLTSEELLVPNAAMPETLRLYGDTFDAHGVVLDGIYVTSFGPSEAQVQVNGIAQIWGNDPENNEGAPEITAPVAAIATYLSLVPEDPTSA